MRIAIAVTLLFFAFRTGVRAWRAARIQPGQSSFAALVMAEASLAVWCFVAAVWLLRL